VADQLVALPDKLCTRCTVVKPRSEFSERWNVLPSGKRYRASNAYCKSCASEMAGQHRLKDLVGSAARQRRSRLKTQYGLTIEDYDAMLRRQGGGCAICGTAVPGGLGGFHVDHCHQTNRVRGLLCVNCNRGIGALKDDANLLRRAIAYLDEERELG
jgi:hypothetical protein